MTVRGQWEALTSGEARGTGAGLARAGLELASMLYGAGLKANLGIYTRGVKPRTRPVLPVISVGNISLGGTGKTTATAFLVRRLQHRLRPAVVLRGYARAEEGDAVIVSDGVTVQADLGRSGDEGQMLAQMLPGCAVAVGKRRERVISLLRERTGAQVVVLDDGFQYFRMERDLDIVLLDALAAEEAWGLFPAGRLREPVSHLCRADQVWITHADIAPPERVTALRALAARHCPGRPVVITRHGTGAVRPLRSDTGPLPGLSGSRVLAVSAVGNPEAFELSLHSAGARVTPLRFPDHHAYCAEDYGRIVQAATEAGAEMLVTTEKDAVKFPPAPTECPPVGILGCDLHVMEGEDAVEEALEVICASHRGDGD